MRTAPHPKGNKARREAAFEACYLAGIAPRELGGKYAAEFNLKDLPEGARRTAIAVQMHCQDGNNVCFDVGELPEHLRRPAAALMYAALAHYLCTPYGKIPTVLHWYGRTWALTPWAENRLHVAARYGAVGMVTPPCAQLAEAHL